jgi:zinc protease
MSRITKKFQTALFLLVTGSALSLAVKAQQPLSLDPAVRYGRLPNGLSYYIRHNAEPKDRVLFYLVNNVGSLMEEDDQQGLAHFMEHMSFNGTTHFPKNDLIDYLQKNGVRFGADINAYTSFDETVYELPIPSDKSDVLKNGLQIIRDWAQNATLDPVEIDKERGVVLEEKRLGKGAAERMRRVYWPLILNGSRYAVRQPIGLDTVLNNFKPETIRRFYHDWYRPDLQAVIVVGDIEVDKMEQELKARFSDLRNPEHERQRPKYTVPLTGQNHFIVATDREMTSTQAEVIIRHPALSLKTEADYRNMLIRDLFNQMLEDRYAELVRQADPPFVQAGAGIGAFMGGLDIYDASVTAKPGQMERGFKAMWRETVRAKRFGFTPTELERAKASQLSATTTALKEKDKTPSINYVREYQSLFLHGEAAPGIEAEYALTTKDLPGITLQEVNALLGADLTTTDRDILILAPEKDRSSLPDSAMVAGWVRAVESEDLQAYKDQVNTLPLLTRQPVPGKITDEKRDQQLNITTLTLSNGLTVVLKPTDFRNDQILFSGFAPGGTSVCPDADYPSAANAAAIIASGGAGNYNLSDLQKFLSGKQVAVQPAIEERSQTIGGRTTPGDLETALQLIYAYMTEPREDTTIFRGIMERSRAQLANRADDPNAMFSDSVSAILGNYSVRRTGPTLEKLAQIDLAKAYRIYKERFSDASAFTFTFVGSFDIAAVKPLLEKYLGSLPSTHAGEQAKDLGLHIPSGVIAKTFYKGTEPKATVYMILSGAFDYNKEDLIRLDALKEVLQIRMLQRLREDESGVYSPGVRFNAAKYPQGRYSMVINFGCAPQNADKLIASALDEVSKLRQNGPLQENIDKWRAEEKSARETQLKTNSFWIGYLSSRLQNKEDLHQVDQYSSELDKVTVPQLQDAARHYLSGNDYIRLELLPASSQPGTNQ